MQGTVAVNAQKLIVTWYGQSQVVSDNILVIFYCVGNINLCIVVSSKQQVLKNTTFRSRSLCFGVSCVNLSVLILLVYVLFFILKYTTIYNIL
jgi:hypothetical protein